MATETLASHSMPGIDSRYTRLNFVPARYATERPTHHLESNIVLLETEAIEESEMGRKKRIRDQGPRTRSQKELFPAGELSMQWLQVRRVGSGLANLGNTCFMNSVLQCLIHTPPLAELLLSGRNVVHTRADHGELDPIGMTQRLVQESLLGKREYVSPVQHAKSLKRINRWFRLGRQEDAHEYLIALLDAMHDRSISGMNPKPSRELEYTSFVYQIFGGRIRSQVKCTQCDYESNTYDPFLDLSLEITRAHSVQKALQRFTAGEVLDGANSYKCPKQNTMVKAVKRMTIEDVPNVLIVQLKRFEFSRSGRKISKHVDFDPVLDVSPFMSHPPKQAALYDLYGILVHQGHSMHSGHYYCFLKGSGGGEWHKFDDTRVCATSSRNAMGQSPYILFYIKRQAATNGPSRDFEVEKMAPAAGETKNKKKRKKAQEVTLDDMGGVEEEKVPVARRKSTMRKEVHVEEDTENAALNKKRRKKKKAKEMDDDEEEEKDPARSVVKSPLRRVKRGRINGHAIGISPIAQHTAMLLKGPQKQHSKGRSAPDKRNTKSVSTSSSGSDSSRKVRRVSSSQSKAAIRGKDAIANYKTSTVGMGLQQWDDVDIDSKRQRDRNMWKTVVPRKEIDAYDAEYDKGKTKRIKDKAKSGGYLGSTAFDAVAKKLRNARKGLKKSLGF